MKVSLWNIGGGFPLISRSKEWKRENYQEENISAFIDILKSNNPDVISLQEIHSEDSTHSEQLKKLSKGLGMSSSILYPYGQSHLKKGSLLTMAILSKFPIKESVIQKVPNPNLQTSRPNGDVWRSLDCGFLTNTILYKGQEIFVIDGHLVPLHYFGRNYEEKEFDIIRQAIVDILLSLAEKPSIVAADFNFENLAQLVPELFPVFTEIFHQSTTPASGQQDHILVSHHFNVLDWEVKESISDHSLCSVTIELENEKQ